jgi:hypothetical protein
MTANSENVTAGSCVRHVCGLKGLKKLLLEGQRYCLYRRNSILRETLVHILDVRARQERKFGQSLY